MILAIEGTGKAEATQIMRQYLSHACKNSGKSEMSNSYKLSL